MNLFPFLQIYADSIYATGRQPAFVMLLAFVVTFIIARAYTRIARRTGWGSASFGGVHAHHMVFGVVLSFLAGGALFAFLPETNSWLMILLAVGFGSGAALVLDEFALLLHLEDVYWEEEGRKSIDAVVIGLLLGIIFLMQVTPLVSDSTNTAGMVLITAIIINLGFVIVAALKGKIITACFGVFIPILAQVGALRIAEPTSPWARKFYSKGSRKMKKSKKRYARYEKQWKPIKEKAWDIIGGKTGR